MFSRFSSIFHHAVDALAPHLSVQEEFVAHWKTITRYFIENKDHKVSVESTILPLHLEKMLVILFEEEKEHDGMSGPCMEYLLQHKILETLYSLARTDVPPGMKTQVLLFFTKLLSKIKQPLLPHVSVHRAVCRIIRTCGEIKAAPSESEEIQFLCTVCAKLKTDPYLVNFFIEKSDNGEEASKNPATEQASFPLVESLLTLLQSPDTRVSLHACEGLMLCASLPETTSAQAILHHSTFCEELIAQLVSLYSKLPKEMDPVRIDSVDAKWGLDASSIEDHQNFTGKKQLVSFLAWLDYLDQLVHVSHLQVAAVFSHRLRKQFLEEFLQPAILHQSETVAINSTAHLARCLRLVTSTHLVREFGEFILGTDKGIERVDSNTHKLRGRLIERCDHLSDEMSIMTLKLFELLLVKGNEHILHNLVLRNLLGRSYVLDPVDSGHPSPTASVNGRHTDGQEDRPTQDGSQLDETVPRKEEGSVTDSVSDVGTTKKDLQKVEDEVSGQNQPKEVEKSNDGAESESITDSPSGAELTSETGLEAVAGNKDDAVDDALATGDFETALPSGHSKTESDSNSKAEDGGTGDHIGAAVTHVANDSFEDNVDLSPPGSPMNTAASAQRIVNSLLSLLPEEAKSSYQMADSGYDTYLRDAHKQFAEVCRVWENAKWPSEPVMNPVYSVEPFYEGAFLNMIFLRLSKLLHQSYEMNLQVTSVVSCLAYIPHPNLNEFLLNTLLPTKDDVRSLPAVLSKVVGEVQTKAQKLENFQKQLIAVRKELMGTASSFTRTEGSNTLEAVIVLEEFCKELAAVAFVKWHAIGMQQLQ